MKLVKVLIFVAVLSLTATSSPQQTSPKLSPQTRENLMKALHGEAFAYAKYMAYAEQARKSGHNTVADLFEETAKTEHLEHFNEMARLAGLAGSDADNLKDAIKGETEESQTMYPHFAELALAAGDQAAADRFLEIRRDEEKHRILFQDALDKLEQKSQRTDHPSAQ
ncbi:MAG TPA: rubrerythrin family protein [Terriglobia bacterium]|nr:rubrerythrin family protein [Terriglobia bacterium]